MKYLNKYNKVPNNIFSKAFTIAEILITLGIIGVVAALTIPALLNSTNNLEYKSAWKKDYSVIMNAQKLINDQQGGFFTNWAGYTDANIHYNLPKWEQYLTFQKECKTIGTSPSSQGCWYPDSLSNGINVAPYPKGRAQFVGNNCANEGSAILSDGSLFVLYDTSIYIDVNGFKGPNQDNKDIFVLIYNTNTNQYEPQSNYWGNDSKTPLLN